MLKLDEATLFKDGRMHGRLIGRKSIIILFVVASAAFIYFFNAPTWGSQFWLTSSFEVDASQSTVAAFSFYVASAVALYAHWSYVTSPNSPIFYNRGPESQIDLISRAIRSCEKELILFSGRFKSEFYEDERILSALRGLDQQNVFLYCRDEQLDPGSQKVSSIILERNWPIEYGMGTKQSHFLIVDRIDCRIEMPSDNDGGNQPGVYFEGRPDLCTTLLKSFNRNVLVRNKEFDRNKLPKISV